MARKQWTAKTDATPELLRFRAKRKWQIALRRYVLEELPSVAYAPYFALDIKRIREWFAMQFTEDMNWDNFGKNWQFDHVVPVVYFDFDIDEDLKLCWNFTNLRIEPVLQNKGGHRVDVLAARSYFKELSDRTGYGPCLKLLEKVTRIEASELLHSEPQFEFLTKHRKYLDQIEGYSAFEFELLNSGRSVEDVNSEIEMLKKLKI